MASDKGIIATKELGEVIANFPSEQHDAVLRILEARAAYFLNLYDEMGPLEFVKSFYEAFDEIQAPLEKGVTSCKKGCHFCYRQNVQISPAEAMVIVEYCKAHGIDIPRKYLKEQLKYGWREVAKEEVGWCVFLKGGECSIYPARPLACRKYYVSSPPEHCDVIAYPPDKFKVRVVIFTGPEIDASAFFGVLAKKGKHGRLPELLLPYSR